MRGFLCDMGLGFSYTHSKDVSVMKYVHVHPQYELLLVLDPVSQYSVINGLEYSYKHPCAILSAPFTVHSTSCVDPEAASFERYVFYFDKKLFNTLTSHLPDELFNPNIGLLFKLTEESAEYMKKFVSSIGLETANEQEKELSLAFILNRLFDFCEKEDIVTVGSSSFYMQDVLQYISENFNSDTAADSVAEKFSVSRSKLDRDFKRFTGVTTHKFVELCRLNHAKFLLSTTHEYSIEKICEKCGFFGTTHFFPFFKKHTGMTPLEFRKASLEE